MSVSSATTSSNESPLSTFSFPRTGKRGVPQQFPRRLYEMLDSETKLIQSTPDHPKIIAWSDSGTAFRIFDAVEFAASVLPKYFRTRKFSSFQRNLNLYGFTKVRRGPDADFYAHPSFLQDTPDGLLNLRKMSPASRRRLVKESKASTPTATDRKTRWEGSRSVSPSPPTSDSSDWGSPIQSSKPAVDLLTRSMPQWTNIPSLAPESRNISFNAVRKPILPPIRKVSMGDRGRLDLLAFALETQAFAEAN
ncbi:predicted protein [Phaeodactylum tricornutum CCAP 1055/1]|jgi:hypothetical protein|uniref:HSF-type DNA-binding domain-containing protein n=2 Tax=Phaeodactylum tricornutum TaxID=2850 RepID=B7FQG4_PHATC|nr:predicted protein [Phaeodactylum tricornutum CCAP 1055/1]EEC51861.1 predicted protein [Phaeodactylum tricornutum CCAP 1055/1]|eukprot:XP_002177398.1 predicted protein [Phaeodactylum tricornutum CCAP 1055/1]